MDRSAIKAVMFRRGRKLYPYALAAGKAADIRHGAWREPELELIQRCVQPGQTAIDIGANYGLWSYHLAQAVGPEGHVISFEPIPDTVTALRRVLRLLGVRKRVQVIPAGAGERDETVSFQIPVSNHGIPIGGLAHINAASEIRQHVTIPAYLRRVDDIPVPGDVAFLKVDVEGAELYALRGAEQTLRQHKPVVVCEIGTGLLKERYGIDVSDLTAFLSDLGYSEPMRYTPDGLERVELNGGHDGNYVFATPERLAALSLEPDVEVGEAQQSWHTIATPSTRTRLVRSPGWI